MSKRSFFTDIANGFTEWLQRLGYAQSTIKHHYKSIDLFTSFITSKGIIKLEDITGAIILDYQDYLESQPIGLKTLQAKLGSLRLFDQYLENYGYTPIITVKLKVIPDFDTPKNILTQSEIKSIYTATDQSALGYRDRAMLAIYYGCGLRATEGLLLQLKDIDIKTKLLQVRKTKTYQPRYVPMSEQVQNDLQEWLEYGRKLMLKVESDTVLVHGKGQYADTKMFSDRLKKLLELAEVDKQITLHGLRHSIATHLLENGMELEQIRQFLGHSSLEITQCYTHLMYEQL